MTFSSRMMRGVLRYGAFSILICLCMSLCPVYSEGVKVPPLLVFEIDEGMPKSLINFFRDDLSTLERKLENIYLALEPLLEVYPVAVLIYPTHLYDAKGWGKSNPAPIDTIHPALKRTFEFFQNRDSERRVGIFLEIYSSGIATNQNGDLAEHPMPPLRFGGEDRRKGLSMDMDTLVALKAAYPEVFLGVRFHEIYGSDLVFRIGGERNERHGFLLDEEVVRGCIDACRDSGLILLWSDSNWLAKYNVRTGEPAFVYSEQHLPYYFSERAVQLQDYAEEQLGKLLCFSYANNNYHKTQNLEFLGSRVGASQSQVTYPLEDWLFFEQPFEHYPLKDRKTVRWGLSIQSWFWHELTNTLNRRYYLFGENNCPIEVLGAYSLKGLQEGAAILQYEPPWYFFNMDVSYLYNWTGRFTYQGSYERAPDHSARLVMKRLTEILLDPDRPENPPAELDAWFDRNQQRFLENDISNPPLNYHQTTFSLLWKGFPSQSYDMYSDGRTWVRQDAHRYREEMFDAFIHSIERIELQGDGVDELMLLRKNAQNELDLAFYNQNSGRIATHTEIVADNTDGEFFALTAGNFIQEFKGQGDPDEIAVVRKAYDSAGFHLQVYQIAWLSEDLLQFRYEPLPEAENEALLKRLADSVWWSDESLFAVRGLRLEGILHYGHTRNLDTLLFAFHEAEDSDLQIKARFPDGEVLSASLVMDQESDRLVDILTADRTLNRRDDVSVLIRQGEHHVLAVHQIIQNQLEPLEFKLLEPPVENWTAGKPLVFALRKAILVNAPLPEKQ